MWRKGEGHKKCRKNKQAQAVISIRKLKGEPLKEKNHNFFSIWVFKDRKRERERRLQRKLGKMNSRENAKSEWNNGLWRAFLKDVTLTWEAREALSDGRAIEPRVKRLKHNLKRHILSTENVTSDTQRTSRQLIKGMSRQQECHVDARARP